MTPITPLVQFPWPLFLGAGVGLALAVGVSLRGLRSERRRRILAVSASAVAGASTGAFAGLVWLWGGPMSKPVSCLYSCNEVAQFLTNEQFRQIVLMTDLAWVLPVTALLFAAVAVWSWRRGPRR
ncbi:hypothetical protein [Dietzia kunjamensis]|uniref:hypothetical protein n=1 Tax=Dietzia kunjamensis TaxID=322509 RepID=UPI0038902D3C